MKRLLFIITIGMALLPNAYSQTGKRTDGQTPPADPEAPVTARDGKPLPAGGGEPGKALVQYMTDLANARSLEETIRVVLNGIAAANTQLKIDETKIQTATAQENEMALSFLRTFHLIQNVKVTGGFIAKDRATLKVIGVQDKEEVEGDVNMHLEGGQWKVGKSSVSPTGKKRN